MIPVGLHKYNQHHQGNFFRGFCLAVIIGIPIDILIILLIVKLVR
jgi:hypothetical protein